MEIMSNLLNKWSTFFHKNQVIDDNVKVVEDDSVGATQEEMEQPMGPGEGDVNYARVSFKDLFSSKKDRISFYRDMSLFPEITDALDNICDDAVIDNGDNNYVDLEFARELPKTIERKIRKEFDYLITDIFKYSTRGWEYFRKWLIEGELFLEMVPNKKKNGIGGLKVLPAYTMSPMYKGNVIQKFIQSTGENTSDPGNEKDVTIFEPNQILYINYGVYGKNLLDVRGFLESSIRPFNQLRSVEDSIVIYRLVRAPERRVWNIDVGRMPKGKAEEYIKKLISKYRKKLNYNSDTGAINSSSAYQSMIEDFWFAKTESGGSSVESLAAGMNLGDIEDVQYFLKKLYKTLKLPRTRWAEDAQYDGGEETTRDEVKFSRFIERLRKRFQKLFTDSLLLQLKLKKFDKKYLDPDLFVFDFVESNLFKEYKERKNQQAMLDVWSSVSSYVMNPDNAESDGVFSVEFAMKKMMGMSDSDYDLNQKLRKEEMARLDKDYKTMDDEEDPDDEPVNEPVNEPTEKEPEPDIPDEDLP